MAQLAESAGSAASDVITARDANPIRRHGVYSALSLYRNSKITGSTDVSTADMPDPMAKRVGYCIKRAQSALRTCLDEGFRPLGLTAPQYAVLSAIELEPGISNAALARAAFVTPQTMQGIVANLERAGLLMREADPTHGRIIKGRLTATGRKILSKAHLLSAAVESGMLGSIRQSDAEKMATWLTQCADNLAIKRAVAKAPFRP